MHKSEKNGRHLCLQNHTHKIVHSSAMHYQNVIIIRECSKKLLEMKNSKSFFLTPSTINAVDYYLWYGVVYKWQYTDKTLTLRKSMYMRANGASELGKFSNFYILKLLFLSIFCWYFRYFVGTNDMHVGLHVATNFQMYRQNSEKTLLGGGGVAPCPPPPPPGSPPMI